jgi:DNA-binding GntR family transcriptional regulator
MSSVAARRLTDHVYGFLVGQISSGEVEIGATLNAMEIAQRLSVSRPTVDRSILRLVGAGWVRQDVGGRPLVIAAPPPDAAEGPPGEFLNQTDRAYRAIVEQILLHRLQPGEILKEARIAEELELNRVSICRAAERLSKDGLLVRLPRRGWQVVRLRRDEVRDLCDMRLLLEPLALRNTIRDIDDLIIERLRNNLRAWLRSKAESLFDRQHLDYQFHHALCSLPGRTVIADTVAPVLLRLLFTIKPRAQSRFNDTDHEHEAILDAVVRRDARKAVEQLKAHLQASKQYYLSEVADS